MIGKIGIKEKISNRSRSRLGSRISKESSDRYLKGGRSILNGVNIIVWILYVYCSVTITCFKLPVRSRFSFLCLIWLWSKKTLSYLASQNTRNQSRDEGRDVCTGEKYPRTYAKPKIIWTSYKIYHDISISLQYDI